MQGQLALAEPPFFSRYSNATLLTVDYDFLENKLADIMMVNYSGTRILEHSTGRRVAHCSSTPLRVEYNHIHKKLAKLMSMYGTHV